MFSVFLALTIVLGYTGVTISKMVCAAENGKVVLSVVDIEGKCAHSKPKEKSCCRPSDQKDQAAKRSCCDYSHQHHKIDDESRVEQQFNSANHYLQSVVINTGYVLLLLQPQACSLAAQQNPPPLLSLRKQPFQAFTQSYLI